jgi:hypothetical protein
VPAAASCRRTPPSLAGSRFVSRSARRPHRKVTGVRRAVPVVGKSTHRDRIDGNARVFDFSLSPTDTAELDSLDRTGRTDRALERTWWSS